MGDSQRRGTTPPPGPRWNALLRGSSKVNVARIAWNRAATGVLLRRYRLGESAIPGFLDDYALFTQALLDLYEAQFDRRHLELAIRLTEQMRERFEDRAEGAFFSTAAGDSSLVLRVKEDYDGAEPSGNSVAILNLLRLAQITNRAEFRESAELAVKAFF